MRKENTQCAQHLGREKPYRPARAVEGPGACRSGALPIQSTAGLARGREPLLERGLATSPAEDPAWPAFFLPALLLRGHTQRIRKLQRESQTREFGKVRNSTARPRAGGRGVRRRPPRKRLVLLRLDTRMQPERVADGKEPRGGRTWTGGARAPRTEGSLSRIIPLFPGVLTTNE